MDTADKTIEATITEDQIKEATEIYSSMISDIEELERLIGTYETYGTFSIVRPDFSRKVA